MQCFVPDIRAAVALASLSFAGGCATTAPPAKPFDVVIRSTSIVDGSGRPPMIGDIAILGDRIVQVGGRVRGTGKAEIDGAGLSAAPGFINMLSQSQLFDDGRGQSDLRQGVTLEIVGEGRSEGPLSPAMIAAAGTRRGDWTTLGGFLDTIAASGISPNIASFVGAATVRMNALDSQDVDPTPAQLDRMRSLVRQAMEEGALGLSSGLIYIPGRFAEAPELTALATEAGACGGIYITHMRSEAGDILNAIDETVAIARASGTPAEIYHLKVSGKDHWALQDAAIARIEAARKAGVRLTADMYPYEASRTGFDTVMPPWVQEGGTKAWIERLRDPAIRARVVAEMRAPAIGWTNNIRNAGGPENVMIAAVRNPANQAVVGKTLAEIARERGVSAEDAAIDLVITDGSRVGVLFFQISMDNIRKIVRLPYMSFGSDEAAPSAEGEFLKNNPHPRAYGTFARILGRFVRDEKLLSLPAAIRQMTSLPAGNLGLRDRGLLKPGYFADVVLFDPATVGDKATFARPHQYATGVRHVFVNGIQALKDGEPTGADSGRVVRGRGWTGWPDGGCRASAAKWRWDAR
jgi:N-acyl-D-amino-acid deacylase